MRCLLFAALVLVAPLARAQPAALSPEALARADSLVAAAVAEGLVAGAVLSVSSADGASVQRTAHGYARRVAFDGSRLAAPEPMTTEHVFDLASLTKVFATTTLLMRLVDAGRVDLDEPVRRYLPGFTGPSKDSVTVRHLLTHTGGLAPWTPVYYHAATAEAARAYVEAFPLAAPVGQARRYSDLGFMLLGYLIEATMGEPLHRIVEHEIAVPLRLGWFGYRPSARDLSTAVPMMPGHPGFAATSHGNPFERRMVADDTFGYVCDEDPDAFRRWRQRTLVGEVNDGNAYYAHGGVAGHAGLFGTADDLTRVLQMVLDEGRTPSKCGVGGVQMLPYIAPETVALFLETDPVSGNALGWGKAAGVIAVDDPPPGAFGHTGFTGTWAVAFPAEGERPAFSVVLLTNRQHGGVDAEGRYPDLGPLRRAVAAALLGR